MAWPQAPAPQPAPPSGGAGAVPIPAVLTAIGGLLTFFFSFVRIFRVDEGPVDTGWSVWTTDFTPGLFGVGTWIPFFAVVAAAIAIARMAVKGLDDKEILGFRPAQLQLVAVVFALLIWFGYAISILFAGGGLFSSVDFKFGLGMFLLFLGLLLTAAGTVMGLLAKTAPVAAGGPAAWDTTHAPAPTGQWQPAADPTAAPAPQPEWQQPAAPQQWDPAQPPAPAAPQPQWEQPQQPAAPQQWEQPQAPAPQPQWEQPQQPAAPQQPWEQQPQAPAADPQVWGAPPPPPAADPAQWQPPASATPPPPPPASGGALYDPGTQVIPGPPPAPPAEDPVAPADPPADGSGGLPPIPPSNTP